MELFVVTIFILALIASIFSPLIGLYTFFVITYIRPQDFNIYLANIEPAKVALIATFISFVFHRIVKREPISKASQNWALLGILVFILISRIHVIDPIRWWIGTEDFLRVVSVYFIFINLINTQKKLKTFFIFFLLLNLYIGLRFYISYKSGTAIYWGSKPGDFSYGFLANADDLGMGMVVALPFALIPVFYRRNIITKGIYSLASICFMLGILATRSRGALLGLFTIFITTLFSQIRIKKLKHWTYVAGLIVALFLFAAFNYKYQYVINEQYLSAKEETDPGRMGRNSSWAAANQMVKDNPLKGVGRGNFAPYWASHYAPGVFGYQAAHNILWEVASEIGVIGLTFFLFFSLYGVIEIFRLAKKRRKIFESNSFLDMIFTVYIISVIGFYVSGMFITVAFYWHIYILVAMFVSAKTIFKKEMAYVQNK